MFNRHPEDLVKKISLLAAFSFLLVLSTQPGTAAEVLKLAANPLLPSLTVPAPLAQACQVVYPVAGDDYVTTAKNTPVTFSPLWNDTDTPDQDFWGYTEASHGTLEQVGVDALKYTPGTNYVGSDSFTYTLGGCLQCSTYGGGGSTSWCSEPESDEGTVYITVTN